MENDRVDKSEYKQVVEREKKKLLKQVIALTVVAALVAGGFMITLLNGNPHITTTTA
jgi:hypothetical protein